MISILQLVLNGILAGTVIALPAIGFNVIFAVQRITNFSLAAHMAVGAYTGYVANTQFGLPAIPSIALAFVIAGLVGVVSDAIALRPLRKTGALVIAIASMALNLLVENVLRLFFGNEPKSLDVPIMRDWIVGPFRLGPQQLGDFATASVVMVLLFGLLVFTPLGRAMRAVADNPGLADIKGIDPGRMAMLANFLGMGLGGMAGVLLAFNTAITADMGFTIILSVFAAAVVGGLGNIPGGVAGALLISIAEELSTTVMPTSYRSLIGFIAIILTLAFLPRGLFGGRATS